MRDCVAVVGPLRNADPIGHRREHPRRSRLMETWLSHFLDEWKGAKTRFMFQMYGIGKLLIAIVAYGEPGNYYMHDVNTPNGTSRVNKLQTSGETRYSSTVGFLANCIPAAYKKSLRFFGEL